MDSSPERQTGHRESGQICRNVMHIFNQNLYQMCMEKEWKCRFKLMLFFAYPLKKFISQDLPSIKRIKTSLDEEGTTYTIKIDKPSYKDRGKYSCDIDGVVTTAYLDVEGELDKALDRVTFEGVNV